MSSILKTGFGKAIIGVIVIIVLIIAGTIIIGLVNQEPTDDTPELTILTRHDTAITNSFRLAFLESSYGKAAGYAADDINKINFKSVSTLQGWLKALGSDTTAVDLAWGGGPTLFNQMVIAGLLASITDQELLDIFTENIPAEIAGAEMYHYEDNELVWVANALSSFGFTINRDVLAKYNLPTPVTWIDLASPEFFVSEVVDAIAMGNPTQTTSNTRIYQIILQKYGWDRGWEILSRMSGNGGLYGGSVETRSPVIDGRVAVAMTIDFYGIFAQSECDVCEYIIPENASVVNADPIAFGKKGKNLAAAIEFVKYVNTAEGQALWVANHRLPINTDAFDTPLGLTRPDIKELYDISLANQGIEFNETLSTETEFTMQQYFEAVIDEPHTELKAAWGQAVSKLNDNTINQTEFDAEMATLFEPQLTIEDAIAGNTELIDDPAILFTKSETWSAAAQSRYSAYSSFILANQLVERSISTLVEPQVFEPVSFVAICVYATNDGYDSRTRKHSFQ